MRDAWLPALALLLGLSVARVCRGQSFTLYDVFHLRYQHTATQPKATALKIVLVKPAGEQVLREGGPSLGGFLEVTGLTDEPWRIEFRSVGPKPDQPNETRTLVEGVAELRRSTNVVGTLVTNMVVNGPPVALGFGQVTIPAGLRLELRDFTPAAPMAPFQGVHPTEFSGGGSLLLDRCDIQMAKHGELRLGGLESAELRTCRVTVPEESGHTLGRFVVTNAVKQLVLTDSLITPTCQFAAADHLDLDSTEFMQHVNLTHVPDPCLITDCVFRGTLDIPVDGSWPRLTGNSFLHSFWGVRASRAGEWITGVEKPASDNYWGGAWGPVLLESDLPPRPVADPRLKGWLDGYGGLMSKVPRDFTSRPTGRHRVSSIAAPRRFPEVWLADVQVGQNVLGGGIRERRPMLFSFDVRCTGEPVAGARFQLEVVTGAGTITQRFDPLNPGFVIRRDPGPPTQAISPAARTLNFLVPEPAVRFGAGWFNLQMDATGVTGFATPGPRTALVEQRAFEVGGSFRQPLRVGVVPVEVRLPGYAPAGSGAALTVGRKLEYDLQAMWPLRADEIEVRLLAPIPFNGYWTSLSSRLWSIGFMSQLNAALADSLDAYNATRPASNRLARLVAVVGKGALKGYFSSGADGATFAGSRICMVDETAPSAAIHELAHTFGLYLKPEQYDLPTKIAGGLWLERDRGQVIQGLTAFLPEAGLATSYGCPQRFWHYAAGLDAGATDIMGAWQTRLWISRETHQALFGPLYDLLGAQILAPALAGAGTGPGATERRAITPAGPQPHGGVPPGHRRLAFRMAVEWQSGNYLAVPFHYRILPHSVTCADVTSLGVAPDEFPLPVSGYLTRDGGTYGVNKRVWNYNPGHPYPPGIHGFSFTADIPETFTSVELWDATAGAVLFRATPGTLAMNVTGPAPGVVGGGVQFSFSPDGPGGVPGPDPVEHEVLYRPGADQPWVSLTGRSSLASFDIPTATLPPGTGLEFLLRSTRGAAVWEKVLTGYEVPDRPPLLEIRSPVSGMRSEPGAPILLDAAVWDAEDGGAVGVDWASSRDGRLAGSATLQDVVLSAGQHTLTCTARDAAGHVVQRAVGVTVGAQTRVDLDVDAADLSLAADGSDPVVGRPATLQRGRRNRLQIQFRNQGVAGTARFQFFARLPGRPEEAWLDETNSWEAFAVRTHGFDLVPTSREPHRFRAQIEPLRRADGTPLPDADLFNNEYEWTLANTAPVALGQVVAMARGSTMEIVPTGHDAEGDPLTYAITQAPAVGTLEGWTYRAPLNAPSGVELRFRANDGLADSVPATITIRFRDAVLPALLVADAEAYQDEPWTWTPNTLFDPTSFAAEGLPPGLSLDPRTGVISGAPTAAGTFTIRVTASNAAGGTTRPFGLVVHESLATWIRRFGLTGTEAEPGADPDEDGLNNLIEYAFKTRPEVRQDDLAPRVAVRPDGSLAIRYRQRLGGSGWVGVNYRANRFTYAVQTTFNLDPANWETSTVTLPVAGTGEQHIRRTNNGDGTETVEIPVLYPESYPAMFLRVLVTVDGG